MLSMLFERHRCSLDDPRQWIELHDSQKTSCELTAELDRCIRELSYVPAGIYAKVHYGTSLSNVDWLHGGAESLLTLTNLFIVLGLRGALRKIKDAKLDKTKSVPEVTEKQSSA